jgi:hypothetical protein
LVTDGSSDAVLRHPIVWLIKQHLKSAEIQFHFADLRAVREPPTTLAKKLRCAVDLYPCDLLFVHRDAEREEPQNRRDEICRAAAKAGLDVAKVCVVPVRMTEAWLLFNATAVRRAAGNPNGCSELAVPAASPETIVDPKELLHGALRAACGLTGRRLKRFNTSQAVHRIAENIDDFSPLRKLVAFGALEAELVSALRSLGR